MQKFEVMATDNFKTKQVTKPKIGSIGVKVEKRLTKNRLQSNRIQSSRTKRHNEPIQTKKRNTID